MEGIKRILNEVSIQSTEQVTNNETIQQSAGGISSTPDQLEVSPFSTSSLFGSAIQNLHIQEQPESQKLQQELAELKTEKEGLTSQIQHLEQQVSADEFAGNTSAIPQLQQQITALQQQLAKVDVEIQQLLQQIEQLQQQEQNAQDQAQQANDSQTQIFQNLDKAAESLAEIRSATDEI